MPIPFDMNKRSLIILTVFVLTIITFFAMYFLTDFGLKKSLFISLFGAVGVLIGDLVILNIARRQGRI